MSETGDRAALIRQIAELEGKVARIKSDQTNPFGEIMSAFDGTLAELTAKIASLKASLREQPAAGEHSKESPDTDTKQLIPWIASDADFAELISVLRERGYIRAETDTAAYRICAPYFGGVNQDSRTLLQQRKRRDTPHFDNVKQATARPRRKSPK